MSELTSLLASRERKDETMSDAPDGPDFGRELRRYRAAAGLTLRSLAEQVAFDYSYLAQVERGERTGSMRLAHRCDTALSAWGHLIRLFADHKRRQSRHEHPGDS